MPIPKLPKLPKKGAGKGTGGASISDVQSSISADEMGLLQINEDNAEAIAQAIDQALVMALEECGLNGERFAKDNLTRNGSVDTGRLRNSVTHQLRESEKAVYIGTNVEYGPYVELGTERGRPKPYLVPAARDHEGEYKATFKRYMTNA